MKKKLIATLLSTIMVVMMLVPSVFAATTVTGNVYTATGGYLTGATVTLVNATAPSVVATTVTDSYGGYTFSGVADGSYTITVSTTGYTTSQSIVINSLGITGSTIFRTSVDTGWNNVNPPSNLFWTHYDASGNRHFSYVDGYGTTRYGYMDSRGNYYYDSSYNNGYYGNGYYGNGYYPNDITITGIDGSGNKYFYYRDSSGTKRYGYIDSKGRYYYDTSIESTEYSVTFQTNGGSAVSDQRYRGGSAFIAPTNPIKAGYVFGGWYTDSGLTQIFLDETPVTYTMTLYARWLETQETYDALHGQGNYNPTPTTPAPAPAPAPAPGYTQVPQTNDSTPIVLAFAFVSIGCALFAINLASRKSKKNDVK